MSSKASLFKKNLAKSHLQKTKQKPPPPKKPQNKTRRRKPAQLLLALTSFTLKSRLHKADWLEKDNSMYQEEAKLKGERFSESPWSVWKQNV